MKKVTELVLAFVVAFCLGLVPLLADGPMFPPDPWACNPPQGSECQCRNCNTCSWWDWQCWLTCTWIATC